LPLVKSRLPFAPLARESQPHRQRLASQTASKPKRSRWPLARGEVPAHSPPPPPPPRHGYGRWTCRRPPRHCSPRPRPLGSLGRRGPCQTRPEAGRDVPRAEAVAWRWPQGLAWMWRSRLGVVTFCFGRGETGSEKRNSN